MEDKKQHQENAEVPQRQGVAADPTKKSPRVITYFYTSPANFIFLSLITLGLYRRYWFYRNWAIIKKVEGSDISPFWRAVCAIFFCDELFARIHHAAQLYGHKSRLSASMLATLFMTGISILILLNLLSNALVTAIHPGEIILAFILGGILALAAELLIYCPLFLIQYTIRTHNMLALEAATAQVQPHPNDLKYFCTSPQRLTTFFFLTFEVYPNYWFYKNWTIIKEKEGADISPAVRGVFSLFFCHSLFKRIHSSDSGI